MDTIKLMLVDDHDVVRTGLRSFLETQSGFEVIAEAKNGLQALENARERQPDIVLMDINMPDMNGLEATHLIVEQYPQIKVLILTQHDNHEYINSLLQAGAAGYVLKRSGGRELLTAIRQVHSQGAYLEASVARQVLNHYTNPEITAKNGLAALTEREYQVLQLIAKGKSNKEIAHALVISPKTVSVHRTNIMNKLNVQTSFELIRYVTQHQLLEFDHTSNLPENEPPSV